jgi:hypothetical protein
LWFGARGDRDEREAPRNERRGVVQRVQLVEDAEVRERLVGGLEAQRVAEDVTGCPRSSPGRAAREVGDGLLEEEAGERLCSPSSVLVVDGAGGAVV